MAASTKVKRSEKTRAARDRLRHAHDDAKSAVEQIYRKPIDEWDIDELLDGKPRGSQIQAPGEVSIVTSAELERRLKSLTMRKMGRYLEDAMTTLGWLITDTSCDEFGKPTVPPSVKLSAVQYTIDQLIGKPTTKVQVSAGDDIRQVLASALVNPGNAPAYEPKIIEAEVLEDDDDGDED